MILIAGAAGGGGVALVNQAICEGTIHIVFVAEGLDKKVQFL